MDQSGSSYPVKLYIYDLSRGMARQLSPLMLGELLTGSFGDAGWPARASCRERTLPRGMKLGESGDASRASGQLTLLLSFDVSLISCSV